MKFKAFSLLLVLFFLFEINNVSGQKVNSKKQANNLVSDKFNNPKVGASRDVLKAKPWTDPAVYPTTNFYEIQKAFYQKWHRKEKEIMKEMGRRKPNEPEDESKESAYMQYKRWEAYIAPRCYPSGDITLPSHTWENFEAYLQSNPAAMKMYQQNVAQNSWANNNSANKGGAPPQLTSGSGWTFVGPTGLPTGGGAGRINFVRFDPTNSNTIYVGGPIGGLWKSTNAGVSWSTNTDQLSVIGCSDLAINPSNTQTMYLATGDGDHSDSYSIGVLKSIDGGTTWNTSGLSWTVNQGRVIYKMIINPVNPNTLFVATTNGIYRTRNAGVTWTQIQTGSFRDIEFNPKDTTIVYATTTTQYYRSTNGGTSFTAITTGLPTTNLGRLAIGVTNNDSSYVYILAAQSSTSSYGYRGLYRSTDFGATFTTMSTTPNLLGWNSNGGDAGGQGWYTLSIAVSPSNKNTVIVGGVNIWLSSDGGSTWTINGHWTGSGAPYVHADIHALEFLPGSSTTYFAGCDGGIFKTTNIGTAWSDISNNLCIAQIYKIGLSASTSSRWITGHQDNGSNLHTSSAYTYVLGGDGMDCFIDRTNDNVMYAEYYNGAFRRTTNGGGAWATITTGLSGSAAWVTPWYQDPSTANTIYGGYTELFKSTNQGTAWSQLGTIGSTGTIVDFKVAPSNNQTIYVCRSTTMYKTTNGGTSWSAVTLPYAGSLTGVDVKSNDPNSVLITYSGYSSGNKVFKSTNGGTSWTNISTGLPNLPANCIRWEPNTTTDAMYLGCDVGVYFLDNTFAQWQPFYTNMPNVAVYDLELYLPGSIIRAATFGRGVWESPLYNPAGQPPVALYTQSSTSICPGGSITFTDASSLSPTSWAWSFPGGTPSSSTSQNPGSVTWSASGTYTVSLTASNANGSNTYNATVTVISSNTPPFTEGFEGSTFLPANWTAVSTGGSWTQATTGSNSSSKSAVFDNYNTDVNGARDEMRTPLINLSAVATAKIKFDVAYAIYGTGYKDSLEVLVSTNCGTTWTSVYLKGYTALATNGGTAVTAAVFTPTSGQWRTDSVILNTYAGQSAIMISFKNRGHYGQAIYVDNINLTGAPAVPVAAFTPSATTVCVGQPVNFTDNSTNTPTSWTWSFASGTPSSSTSQNPTGVVWNTPGTYAVQLTATNAGGSSTPASQNIVVSANLTPSVAIAASTNNVCAGTSITITATPTNGGSSPTYNFKVNGSTVQNTSSNTYTSTSFANNDAVTCTMTANNTCQTTATANSNSISINIVSSVTPSVSIAASTNNVCAGTSITITATPTNGGSAPTYNFKVNGSTVQNTSSNTYTSTSFANNDAVTCTMTANNSCQTTATANSNTVTINITTNVTPSVSIAASTNNVCAGTSITITATPTNGGSAPTYNFKVNGSTVQNTSSNTYTSTGFVNGDAVTCTMTANNTCQTTATANSNSVTINISSSVTPSVSIAASTNNVCAGTSITITATPTNGGSSPTYNFKVNGTSVQNTSSNTYTSTSFVNGDAVTCTMTANNTCQTTATANSNTVTINITTNVTPSVSIAASTNNVCAGTSITITATPTNGGSSPTYNFKVNGSTVQNTSSNTYTSTGFVNGDAVTCTMTANNTCQTTAIANSNSISINIVSSVTPTVSIAASTNNVCAGTSITITATPTNGGSAPTYNFKVNGSTVQNTSSNTYTSTGFVNGDAVTCTMTANNTCQTTATANSNSISINIVSSVTPTVSIAASTNNVCAGTSITITATPTNGGSSPTYNFKVNGSSVQNTSSNTYTSTSFVNGDAVTCTMTANNTCQTTATANSNTVTINMTTAATWYLDADNDGYFINTQSSCNSPGTGWTTTLTPGGGLGDCNDNNAAVHPGATEVCGNGIDEDCNGSDLACSTPPVSANNDNICSAYSLQFTGYNIGANNQNDLSNPNTGSVIGNNSTATSQPGETAPGTNCLGSQSSPKTLWYKFYGPQCGAISFKLSTLNSTANFNTVFGVYTNLSGDCNQPVTLINCNDNAPAATSIGQSEIIFSPGTLTPGQLYWLQVSGITNTSGNFKLDVDADAPAITATNATYGSIDINLPTVSNQYTTRLRYRPSGSAGYADMFVTGLSTKTVGYLSSGSNYDFWSMYQCNPGGVEKFFSAGINISTIAGCTNSSISSSPIITPLSGHCSLVTVSWPASPAAITTNAYSVYWRPVGYSGYNAHLVNGTSYTLTFSNNLLLNTTYEFWYKVQCAGGVYITSPIATYTTCGGAAKPANAGINENNMVYEKDGVYYVGMAFNEMNVATPDLTDEETHEVVFNKINNVNYFDVEHPSAANAAETGILRLIPNPATTGITLRYVLPQTSSQLSISVTGISGNELYNTIENNPAQIGDLYLNLSEMKNGIYFITIRSDGFSKTEKLIIAR